MRQWLIHAVWKIAPNVKVELLMSTSLNFISTIKSGKVCTVVTRKYCKHKDILACFSRNFKINNSQKVIRIIRGNVYYAYMHLDGYFSVIWKAVIQLILWTKNFLNLYCLVTWNEIHVLMVIHYCMESQSHSITQLTQTPDNSTQITIPLGTYLHVD